MEGHLERDGHRTWYRVVGELDPDALHAPVVICHGGPGGTHDYVAPIAELHRSGRACVLYDQLGNGRSDHLPDADPSFWTTQLFNDELTALVEHLGIDARYHVVGNSWGGMLAMAHALDHPPGLVSVVAADSPADMHSFADGARGLLATLPEDVRETIERHEEAGTFDDPAYQTAIGEFYRRFICRLDPWPDELVRTFDAIAADPTVYGTLNGPSEFTVIGPLRDWSIVERLGEIDVPLLLVSGEHDEVRPEVVQVIAERVPGARWELFETSSHTPHLEEPERFLRVVEAFLEEAETPG